MSITVPFEEKEAASLDRGHRLAPSPVNSFTEWDPLEEVIVGRLSDGVFPTWQHSMLATIPEDAWEVFRQRGGRSLPPTHLAAAEQELAGLVDALRREGIVVRHPDDSDHSAPVATKHWSTNGGLYAAMPRDHLIVLGDTIVEAPMSWRCRYHEGDAYRGLLKSYFQAGAGWLQAPRPQLTEELFDHDYHPEDETSYAITEFEPVFDAADFMRFGHDVVVQQSHVTNQFGIEWLRRVLGKEFVVHCVEVNDPREASGSPSGECGFGQYAIKRDWMLVAHPGRHVLRAREHGLLWAGSDVRCTATAGRAIWGVGADHRAGPGGARRSDQRQGPRRLG